MTDPTTSPNQPTDHSALPQSLSRRTFLLNLGALSGGAALLAACGGTTSVPATATTAASAAPSAVAATATAPATGAATTAPGAVTATTGTTGSAATAVTSASPTAAAAATASRTVASTTASGTPSATAGDATPKIVAAANAFLATLSSTEKATAQFEWTNTAQKQRWSNFPEGAFKHAGLMMGNMTAAQQNACLAVLQALLSAEGYNRVLAEWKADDANATTSGTGGNGGGAQFGSAYYFAAIIGTPSETTAWQWQWGGHHITINATIVGPNIALTPSFIGVQPFEYTDAGGTKVRPLGDIEDAAFALIGTLDATQQKAAVLGSNVIDVVLGPGQDGKTIQAEGLPGSQMTAAQQTAFLALIGHYTGLVNAEDAAVRNAEIKANLAQTYLAWYGPTAKGSPAYFRVTGPTVVIEYSPQGARPGSTPAADYHVHGIYRDPTNDYGTKYTGIKIG